MKSKLVIILVVSVLVIFTSGITYSLFRGSASLKSNEQSIAKFVFDTQRMDQIDLPLIDINPGDTEEYLFYVSNEVSGTTSGVTVEYQLTIKTYHLVPLVIELYKIDNEIEELLITCDETFERNLDNELVCNTLIQEMVYSSSKLDDYKLKVNFPIEFKGEEYSNLVDFINIEINSWQKSN